MHQKGKPVCVSLFIRFGFFTSRNTVLPVVVEMTLYRLTARSQHLKIHQLAFNYNSRFNFLCNWL